MKLFFGGKLDSPKLRNQKKFVLMSEPALKCENNAIFKQIHTLKLLIAFKMAYSGCFSLGGNLDIAILARYSPASIDVRRLLRKVFATNEISILQPCNNIVKFCSVLRNGERNYFESRRRLRRLYLGLYFSRSSGGSSRNTSAFSRGPRYHCFSTT